MVTSLKDVHAFSSKWNLQAVFISSFLANKSLIAKNATWLLLNVSDDLVQSQHCRQYKLQAGYIHEHYCPIHGSKICINVPYSLSASWTLEGTRLSSSSIGNSQKCSISRQNYSGYLLSVCVSVQKSLKNCNLLSLRNGKIKVACTSGLKCFYVGHPISSATSLISRKLLDMKF